MGIIFSFFGIAGTYLGTNVNGAVASTRIIGVMAGGILCGPFVGIVSGIITGIHRILYDIQGITSIACGLTTVIAGFVSAFIYTREKKYSKWVYGLIGGIFVDEVVVFDKNIITSQGPATPYPFAYKIAEVLGKDTTVLRKRMLYNFAGGK